MVLNILKKYYDIASRNIQVESVWFPNNKQSFDEILSCLPHKVEQKYPAVIGLNIIKKDCTKLEIYIQLSDIVVSRDGMSLSCICTLAGQKQSFPSENDKKIK